MLYDLAREAPPRGSLLESMFTLMAKRRQEAQYYQTKAMVMAPLVAAAGKGVDDLNDTLNRYRNLLFPFLEGEVNEKDRETKAALKHWVEKTAFSVKPLWRAQNNRGVVSKLRRGAERIKQAEEMRRQRPHRRIT